MLINLFTVVDPADEAGFLDAFKAAAEIITKQPGFISMQLHRAIGDSPTYLNYVVRESTEAVRAASLIPSSSRNFQHILHPSWPAPTFSRRSPSPASALPDLGNTARRDDGYLGQQSMLV